MSILTPKMKSARTDHYGPSCKLWFPGDDVGNSMVARVGGVIVTDDATAEHDEPHALSIVQSGSAVTGTGIANLKMPKIGMAMAVLRTQATVALGTISIGDQTSGVGLLLGESTANIRTGPSGQINLTRTTSAAANDYMVIAVAWNTANVYYYYGEDWNDAALAASGTISAAQSALLPANFSDNFRISIINPIHSFGMVLYGFGDGLPSDLLVGINSMKNDWRYGKKKLYEPWVPLNG